MSRLRFAVTYSFTFALLIALLAGTASPAVFAQDDPNLPVQPAATDLAVFYPMDSLAFAQIATSPAAFETLDGVLARVEASLPPDALPPGMSLSTGTILDEFTRALTNDTFEASVRPWLGDAIALGIVPMDNLFDQKTTNDHLIPVQAVAAITDREGAATFVENLLSRMFAEWERSDFETFTEFTVNSPDFSGVVMIREDLLVLASSTRYMPPVEGTISPNLLDNTYFQDGLADLPGSDYDGTAYVDTAMLMANAIGMQDNMNDMTGGMSGDLYNENSEEEEFLGRVLVNAVLRAVAPMVVGLTVQDGDTLTLDAVQPLGNITGFEALGIPFDPLPAADPDFMTVLPASTALVIQSTELAQMFEAGLSMNETLVDTLLGTELAEEGVVPEDALALLRLLDIVLGNLTGFSYPRDLRPWMQGNYAIFAGWNPNFTLDRAIGADNFPADFGAVFEVSGEAATRNFVNLAARELQLFLRIQGVKGVTVERETFPPDLDVPVDMTTLTIGDQNVPVIRLALATDGNVLVLGTHNAVRTMLLEDGPGFTPNTAYFLPDASTILYAAPPALLPALDVLAMDATASDIEAARTLLSLLEYATITVEYTSEGDIMRATLTLND